MKKNKIEILILIVILAIASFLIFKNLGQQMLWNDEAETAVIARNILKYGYPSPWDGKNLITQQNGSETVQIGNAYFWAWHPWLQDYLTAGSFKIFGVNNFTARLPFALAAVLSIFVLYLLVKRLFQNSSLALLSSLLLSLSVPFLLYSRQGRYYILAALFGLLVLYFYDKIIKEKKGIFALALFSILLFHSNFYAAGALFLSLILFFLLYDFSKERLKKLIIAALFFLIFTVPWLYFFYNGLHAQPTLKMVAGNIYLYLNQFHYIFPLILLPLLFFIWPDKKRKGKLKRKVSLLIFPILVSWIFMSFILARSDAYLSLRYITYVVPLFATIFALILSWLWQKSPAIAFLVAIVFIFTNIFSLGWLGILNPILKSAGGKQKTIAAQSYLKDYLYEINHNYIGPISGIVKFLRKNIQPGDTLETNYEQESIIFYTDVKIINRVANPQSPVFKLTHSPYTADWIIKRKYWPEIQIPESFQEIEIPYPDLPWDNLPEIDYHKFQSVSGFPKVKIYKPAQ